MHRDYLVVGFGLAGLAFTSILERNNKTFHVIDNNPDLPLRVIGGMHNPVILKRFSPAWKAHEMWQKSKRTYQYFEQKFQKEYFQPFPIYRVLQSVEEQNNWAVASDKAVMNQYMFPNIVNQNIEGIHAPFGFGELHDVGRVKGEDILADYKNYLIQSNLFTQGTFDYQGIVFHANNLEYQGNTYNHIVFSEGYKISSNPFFKYLPMKESKGEMLIVQVPDLQTDHAFKSGCFMVPLGNQLFIVGATYHWDDKTFDLTSQGQAELEEKLQAFLKLPYQILDYKAGIRPTVLDRRPLLGKHPQHKNLAVLNGLGTRGIIYAPALAEMLFEHLESDMPLDPELHIERYVKYLSTN